MLHLSPLFTFSVHILKWWLLLVLWVPLKQNMAEGNYVNLSHVLTYWKESLIQICHLAILCQQPVQKWFAFQQRGYPIIQVQICRYSSYECLEKGKRNGEKCASCGVYVSSEDECIYVWREWKDTWTANLIRFHHLNTPLQRRLGLNRPLGL